MSKAFWAAVRMGDADAVSRHIERDGSLCRMAEKSPSADTALHLAVRGGYRDVVELLLAAGADPNRRNGRGQTPLALARGEIAVILRAAGAETPVPVLDGRPR